MTKKSGIKTKKKHRSNKVQSKTRKKIVNLPFTASWLPLIRRLKKINDIEKRDNIYTKRLIKIKKTMNNKRNNRMVNIEQSTTNNNEI